MKYPDDYINKIINGDCLEVMKGIPDKSIDLVVTSPPYDNLRDYKGYSFDFEATAFQLARILKEGGVIVWVVGDSMVAGSETGKSFEQALYFKNQVLYKIKDDVIAVGLNLHDTMIYKKNGISFPNPLRYHQCFEYMFVFSKGQPKTVNLIEDRKNSQAGNVKNGRWERQSDGTTKLRDKENYQMKEIGARWNIWEYEVGYNKTTLDQEAFEHPAMFPEQLAADHIKSWSNENDLVLDPFNGSGTTTKMARLLNRRFIGIEISPEYCAIAEQRLKQQVLNF